jgi:hypothetical protein
VAAFLRDLQAAGRSQATLRSYGMDLLRWFRPVKFNCTMFLIVSADFHAGCSAQPAAVIISRAAGPSMS